MSAADPLAPPVVTVMVVHRPGEWFDEVLSSLAAQDYPNLRCLFLLTSGGDPGGRLRAMIDDQLPGAFVRDLPDNPGYATAANEVLRLVEGDNGFFCLMHDDVALDRTAIRLLIEELYRSNAGIVGPKLVEWDDPSRLQHVGFAVDRFGEIDPVVEPGEADQEQHDSVRDVFALPSACLMVRADLFRAIEGFDEAIFFHGEDVELCWRAHLTGARVIIVPAARARHRDDLVDRLPELPHVTLAHRNRLRSVVTLTGARRLPLLSLELVVVTVAEVVVAVLTGRFGSAWAAIRALAGLVLRTPALIARRRAVRHLREVPDAEVAALQARGSARLASYLRSRSHRPLDPEERSERRWRETAGSLPAVTWILLLVFVLVGSRRWISSGVPQVGQFLPFPDSPADLFASFRSGWNGHGLGSATANPSALALISGGSVATLFHMGLWHTVCVVGLLLVGQLGMWRLATLFPSPRARVVALAVYALVPLPAQLLSAGRWSALACYAAMPWAVHLLRRIAGIEGAGLGAEDEVERYVDVPVRKLVRLSALLCLLSALVFTVAPGFVIVLAIVGVTLGATTVVARGSWVAAVVLAVAGLAAAVVGVLVNLPWTSTLFGEHGWDVVAGVPTLGPRSVGLSRLARFGVGTGELGVLAIALLVPVLVAPLVSRSWRLTWAVRAAALVAVFAWLAVLDDRQALGIRLPEPGILLAPIAVGVALAAACLVAAFDSDVVGGSFGWRQPLAVVAALCIAVGVVPGVFAAAGGRWNAPALTLSSLYAEPADAGSTEWRTLWIGDERVLPVQGWTLRPGIAYAITDNGEMQIDDAFPGRPSDAEEQVAEIVDMMSQGTTTRIGRLLAPFAVRFIVVPIPGEGVGDPNAAEPAPDGLLELLDDQLDLGRPLATSLNFAVYENSAWIPTRSELTAAGAEASNSTDIASRAAVDMSGARPIAAGVVERGPAEFDAQPGTVHVASPESDAWKLTVDGAKVESRQAFGVTTAFDVTTGGRATLQVPTPLGRTAALVLQLLVWIALAVAASRLDVGRWMPRRRMATGAPLIEIRQPIAQPAADPAGAWLFPGLPAEAPVLSETAIDDPWVEELHWEDESVPDPDADPDLDPDPEARS